MTSHHPGDLGEKATGDTQNLRANMAKIRRKLEKIRENRSTFFTEVGGLPDGGGRIGPLLRNAADRTA